LKSEVSKRYFYIKKVFFNPAREILRGYFYVQNIILKENKK